MFKIINYCTVFVIILINFHDALTGSKDIMYYEYGNRTNGELVSYFYHGSIPIFTPHYCMIIKPEKKIFETAFTLVKVAYYNQISYVDVAYHPENSTLCFDIKFPFIETPIGIWGWSLPLEHNQSKQWTIEM